MKSFSTFYCRIMLAAAAIIASASASASIPAGYYSGLKGKIGGAELKTAVYQIINPHTEISSYQDLPKYFQQTDVYPQSSRWWDMYSDIPYYAPSFSGLNREHSFPKSWWGGTTTVPAYVDLFHLYPSERDANMAKSNYPLGVVRDGAATFDNGITKVGPGVNSGGASAVFEPDDEYKGDFARTYFYVVTCYQTYTWSSKYMWMLTQGTYPTLQRWAIDLLLKWHHQDPVSDKERDRNEKVFRYQNNRNAFIDMPELADYIWGEYMGQAFNPSEIDDTAKPQLITPTEGLSLDFGEVALGMSGTADLHFKGENINEELRLTVGRNTSKAFSIETRTITASDLNKSGGYWVTVKYNPTEVSGDEPHTAELMLIGGNIPNASGSFSVRLQGECLPYPELTAPTVGSVTDLTESSYVANWTVPADEVVDYYVVTRKRYYHDGTTDTEELLAESNSLGIDGFDAADYDTFSVHSMRLNVASAESDVVTVRPASIEGIDADLPFIVEVEAGIIRIHCSQSHSGLRVYDVAGRLIMSEPTVEDGYEISSLNAGIYFIVTDNHRKPIKVLAY